MKGKKLVLLLAVVMVGAGFSWFLINPVVKTKTASPTLLHQDPLKETQQQIAALDDNQIAKEMSALEAKMRNNDLMNRMNKNQVTEMERKVGKETLLRIALLNVERNKRMKR